MKLGLIGKPLGHSWSPAIHNYLIGEDYELWELEESELDDFLAARDFDGINVTIPYKEKVLPYLDSVDEAAARMGAVNCIVNRNGNLTGYNTDHIGLERMMRRRQINEERGRVAILGTGGASKAAAEVCRSMSWDYDIVSRSSRPGCITYDELREATLLINATPVGMHPNEEECPVDVGSIKGLKYVVDIVANPVRTRLCFEAGLRRIKYCGGLEMLVEQALAADELFLGIGIDESKASGCLKELLAERRNIILIGMPSSGKSTIGEELAARLGMRFMDGDDEVIRKVGMPIDRFFEKHGEKEFRKHESDVLKELSQEECAVIATGGGAVEFEENMRMLAYKGMLVWIDRPLELLTPTEGRPLTRDADALKDVYDRRKHLYSLYADARINNTGSIEEAVSEAISTIVAGK